MNQETKPFAVAVVGMTGTGKTTFVSKLIKKYEKQGYTPFIFDINKEFLYLTISGVKRQDGDIDKFVTEADAREKSIITVEEATIFFTNPKRSEKLLKQLVQKRHKNNIIIYVFHSLRALPVTIRDMINYLVLFKTSDNVTLINSKFKDDTDILEMFNEVQDAIDYHTCEVLEINPVDQQSKINLFKNM